MIALIPIIDRYGPAIEWDLRREWQVDLHDYFRGERPWSQLRRFLDGLAPTSRYVIAKRNDPEAALAIARALREARHTEGRSRYRPPAVEWDTRTELGAAILDRLGEVVALLSDLPIAGKKRKGKPPKRTPRPETEIERAERRLSEEHVEEIVADVEAGKVSVEEYARISAEVEAQRAAAQEAAGTGPAGPVA
jgi:hypothetical protein